MCVCVVEEGGFCLHLCVWECFSAARVQECVCMAFCFLSGSVEVHQAGRGRQAGTAVGLLNVGSGLQGGSARASLITAQMPLFIFRTVQLISVPVSEPLGKSDPLLPHGAAHVLSLALSARQAFKTNFKANIVFTASRDGLKFLCFTRTMELFVLSAAAA